MTKRFLLRALAISAVVMLFALQSASAITYSISVQTDTSSYAGSQPLKITGTVSPAPGPNTAVFVQVVNPKGIIVAVGDPTVDPMLGSYEFDVTTGGSAGWTAGTYLVNATWGAFGPQIFALANFTYSPQPVTTTTTSSTTTTTTTTSPACPPGYSYVDGNCVAPPTTTTSTTTSSTTTSSTITTSTITYPTSSSTTTTTSSSSSSNATLIYAGIGAVAVIAVIAIIFLRRRC